MFEGDIAASDDVGVDNVAARIAWVPEEGKEESAPSWMCVDSNPISPSFGATWAAPEVAASLTYGESCSAFLDKIREFPGGNLPPPSASADLKSARRMSTTYQ